MKISIKQEKEVLQIYDKWLHSYLNGDVKTYDFYLDDDYRFIGSTDNEEFLNKEDTTKFLAKTADQLAGKTDIRNNVRTIDSLDGIVFITDLFDAYFLIGKDWTYYGRFRFTSALSKKKAGWRFIYQHFSMPDSKAQEGETLGAEQISKENQELRDAIKRRTIELEQKNRDLEIEAGLERVRSRAMAMQNSNELSELVDTLLQELTKLDFSLTACIINIIDGDDKSNTAWSTNPETGKDPESYYLKFEDYKFHHGMWKAWKARKNSWVYTIEGAEKETYQDYLFNETEFKRFSKKAKKGFMALEKWVASFTFSNFGGLQTIGDKALSEESLAILARFGKVFDLTYTRFNDLRLAEEQAREAQIELALERVRARTMAMQHSDELAEVATVLFQQVKELGIPQWTCGFNIWETGDKEFTFYPGGPDGEILPSCKVSLNEHPIFRQFDESRRRGDELFVYEKKGEVQTDHYRYMHSLPGIGDMLQGMLDQGLEFPEFQIDHIVNFSYGNMIFITYEPVPEMHDVFKRFAQVFEQTYTRFLDLQKAEAQAKEAQIETSLERVRAASMAMHHSADLQSVISVVLKQFEKLDIPVHAAFIYDQMEDTKAAHLWAAAKGETYLKQTHIPRIKHPFFDKFYKAIKNGTSFYTLNLTKAEKNQIFRHYFTKSSHLDVPLERQEFILSSPGFVNSTVLFDNTALAVQRYNKDVFTNEENEVIKRIGFVFEQAYNRFLDLQKAEAQAKEAQIEAALERVRSRSMAMHKSEELKEVIQVVYDQFVQLDINMEHTGFIIDYKVNDDMHIWLADEHEVPSRVTIPYFDAAPWNSFIEAKKKNKDFYAIKLTFKEKNNFYKQLFKYIPDLPEEAKEFYLTCPGLALSAVLLDNVGLYIENFDGIPYTDEENNTLLRFGKVFQQTYTRFLDLQKAEAQTKEAQVEAALERVRAASLAMHNSNELNNAVKILFKEFNSLGLSIDNTSLVLNPGESKDWIGWTATKTAIYPDSHWPYVDLPVLNLILKGWKLQEPISYSHSKAETHKFWKEYFRIFKNFPDQIKKLLLESSGLELAGVYLKNTGVQIMRYNIDPFTKKEMETVGRFGHVFEQTYTRFLDLQKAEAQAREAKIEAALEKVRSRTMAMQHSDELPEAANNLFLQVQGLGIPAWSAGYCVWEDKQKSAWCNMSSEGEIQKGFSLPTIGVGYNFYKPLKNNEDFYVAELGGKKLIKHYDFMKKLPIVGKILEEFDKKGIALPTFQIFHVVYFKHGYLLFITYESVPNAWGIFKRFGKVFDQTYTRFLDLQKAEEQTRTAQISLAVERVRAKALAMHKSEEIIEVVAKLKEEVMNLDIPDVVAATIFLNEGDDQVRMWDLSSLEITDDIYQVSTDIIFKLKKIDPHLYMKRVWENQADYFVEIQDKKGFKRLLAFIREHGKDEIAKEMEEFIEETQLKRLYHAAKKLNNGKLCIDLLNPPTKEMETILTKMGAAFDLAYKRFEDLQKAENQAREAQIETALERVRSRSMAMHKSEELLDVIGVISEQIIQLDLPFDNISFGTNNQKGDFKFWLASPGQPQPILVEVPFIDNPASVRVLEAQKKGIKFFADISTKKENRQWVNHIFKHTDLKHFPKKIKTYILNSPGLARSAFILNSINLYVGNYQARPFTDSENKIFNRFAQVFEQSYTRFLDLQKAENQAREAEIELALERVRSRTMGMHGTNELAEIIGLINQEMFDLGLEQNLSTVVVDFDFDKPELGSSHWIAMANKAYANKFHIPFNKKLKGADPTIKFFDEAKKGAEFYTFQVTKAKKNRYFKFLFGLKQFSIIPEKEKEAVLNYSNWIQSVALQKNSAILVQRYNSIPFSEDQNEIIKRFSVVLEQSYTRFLDLQKAENQAKEAQIEAALERVRSKTMAMHNSQDVKDAVLTLFEEILKQNDDESIRCGIGVLSKSEEMELWTASFDKNNKVGIDYGSLNMNSHPLLIGVKKSWKSKKERFFYKLKGKELVSYFDVLNNAKAYTFKTDITSLPNEVFHNSFVFSEGVLFAFTSKPIPENTLQVFKKFTAVFEQTYTRFLDLQKAEAQVREAQVEAALERVRARTMGMHRASELQETSSVLFKQLEELGIKPWRCGVALLNENEKTLELWSATSSKEGNVVAVIGDAPVMGHWAPRGLQQAIKKQDPIYIFDLSGKKLKEYLKYISQDFKIAETKELAPAIPERLVYYCPIFSKGTLYSAFQAPISDAEIQILQRFTKVFEQTYTRFLDLQKAEKQAREAQIETSLERVRSKAMAMHNSKDLVTTANQLFQEFQQLEISFLRCGVLKIKENKTAEAYSYSQTKDNKAVAVFGNFKLTGHEVMEGVFEHWKLQKEYVHELKGDAVKRYYKLINKQISIPKLQQGKSHFAYIFYFPEGCLYCFTNEKMTDDTLIILRKFNKVMALTYRRYFELQEAEARELAAVKESSLDRVRAEIASMQTADDLNRITPLVWKELNTLGVPFFRCGVFIIDQEIKKVHAYLSTPSGESLAALELEFDSMPLVIGAVSHWQKQKVYIEKWNKEQFIEFTQPLLEQGQINSSKKYQGGLEAPEQLVLQMVPFKQGMLYVGSEDSLTNNQIATVESLAKAFSVAYTRYEDFKELEAAKSRAEDTLSELKSTQTQLIQSEKMASLGELTAGIAHEIQNPLNFVNNFSELSEEMLEELEEEIKDNSDKVVIEIMTDLKQNLNKITNHGKRASNIVKGMLDHSRTGSGISELTDINKLADEYLRLSYHGLRAKDKTFNADFKTDFDETLPKIKVVSQDLGRVILNLINNAFYAVSERQKSPQPPKGGAYKPKVTVSTKTLKSPSGLPDRNEKKAGDLGAGACIEIRVKDNGSGIPDNIKEKIFQPFFTTKPTGSGTGLGLSLAYDIITKGHGGEMKVESKEGVGTNFIIQIPIIS